jgi:hypothetical protein
MDWQLVLGYENICNWSKILFSSYQYKISGSETWKCAFSFATCFDKLLGEHGNFRIQAKKISIKFFKGSH